MSWTFFLVAAVTCSSMTTSQLIINLETKTMDTSDAGMTFGNIDVDIFNNEPRPCSITNLDGEGDDFQKGDINVFEVISSKHMFQAWKVVKSQFSKFTFS